MGGKKLSEASIICFAVFATLQSGARPSLSNMFDHVVAADVRLRTVKLVTIKTFGNSHCTQFEQ